MSKIIVTGASGHLGAAAIRHLLDLGVNASDIAGVVRDKARAAELAGLGVELRLGDYDDAASLATAFEGGEKLLFVSASSMDNTLRVRQHATVVEAARNAGIEHIAYTGFAFADKMNIGLENVHLATEYAIRTTGIPYTFLRNGFYLDLLVNEGTSAVAEAGTVISAAPTGRMNYVTRDNLARAAAVALTSEGHENKIYELTAPQPFTYDEYAAVLAEVSGKPVRHTALPAPEAVSALVAAGVPEGGAGFMVHVVDTAIESGQFAAPSDDLVKLIGDDYTPLKTAVEAVVKG
ncbi:SDR family oxidoreductase [Saccharibacillus sp. CPCC 101409]|uniref:SDR family oxidoreductase n=1 Tax=Saccharibacillus sp. CPCC 101409 TaxID=3058041 RepID=UPI002673326B|nr:SDR family oxidoreductase [Saccharibacillus sp. CPCC 101409]MDO3410006.1 SDR family oxidoreductase [Saccharibacillus sp. CPCC 101409]